MSEENVEIVRRVVEAFQQAFKRGDPAAVFDSPLIAADAEWFPIPGVGLRSVYRGREGFREFMISWTEDFKGWSIRLDRVIDGGDLVAVEFHQQAMGAASGAPIEWDQGFVYEIKNGRVTRMWNYLTLAEALEAAGLSE
jgi:ketosteroid isomerase-like protein